ncbi:MAG TPA: DNA-directed RNA polymerase subunit omega [Polyangia bacterium]
MARVTVEDCLEQVNNHFALVILAASRARQIALGGRRLVECNNKSAVAALREIGAGKVRFQQNVDTVVRAFLAERAALDNENRAAGATARGRRDRTLRTVSG